MSSQCYGIASFSDKPNFQVKKMRFLCMQDSSCLEKNAFCLHGVMYPASCSAQFPKWTCFLLLPAHSWQGAVPAGVLWALTKLLVFILCKHLPWCAAWSGCRSLQPLTQAVAIPRWLWWRTPACTRGVCPCAAPEQSPAATYICPRSLSAHVSQCLTLH